MGVIFTGAPVDIVSGRITSLYHFKDGVQAEQARVYDGDPALKVAKKRIIKYFYQAIQISFRSWHHQPKGIAGPTANFAVVTSGSNEVAGSTSNVMPKFGNAHKKYAAAGYSSIRAHFTRKTADFGAGGGVKAKTMWAEMLFYHLDAEQNLSFATMTKVTEVTKIAFPDSKIAANF